MATRDPKKLKERLEVVRDCIRKGEGLKQAADRLGIFPSGLSQYLDTAGYRDLRIKLGSNTRIAQPLTLQEHVKRLSAVVSEGSQAGASRLLGVSAPAMSKWLKDNGYGPDYERDLDDLQMTLANEDD